MKVNINSIHFKADQKLENFITEKVSKLTHFYEGVIGSEVVLRVENTEEEENKMAEIMLSLKGNNLFAKKQSKTFEEATDIAVEALRKQLIKYKEKVTQ